MWKKPLFKNGDSVSWASGRYDVRTQKSGKVIAYVPADENAGDHIPELRKSEKKVPSLITGRDRYFVLVDQVNGKWVSPRYMAVFSKTVDHQMKAKGAI